MIIGQGLPGEKAIVVVAALSVVVRDEKQACWVAERLTSAVCIGEAIVADEIAVMGRHGQGWQTGR